MVNYAKIIEDLEREHEATLREVVIFQKLAMIEGQIQLLKQLIEREQAEKREAEKKEAEKKDEQSSQESTV